MKLMMILSIWNVFAASFKGPVVYIVAHPDDETIFGATLGKLREQNIPVYGIYITRGEGGKINRVTGNPTDNYSMRPLELKSAAELYGVKEILLLNQPDKPLRSGFEEKPSRDVDDFLSKKIWNVNWIKKRIQSYFEVIRPKMILTLDYKSKGITHAHHQAAGKIAGEVYQEYKMKKEIIGIYGAYELNHYPQARFNYGKKTLSLKTDQQSPALGMTYRKFQAEGAAAHASQNSGHMGELQIPLEKWESLSDRSQDSIFRHVLESKSSKKNIFSTSRRSDVKVIEEQASD